MCSPAASPCVARESKVQSTAQANRKTSRCKIIFAFAHYTIHKPTESSVNAYNSCSYTITSRPTSVSAIYHAPPAAREHNICQTNLFFFIRYPIFAKFCAPRQAQHHAAHLYTLPHCILAALLQLIFMTSTNWLLPSITPTKLYRRNVADNRFNAEAEKPFGRANPSHTCCTHFFNHSSDTEVMSQPESQNRANCDEIAAHQAANNFVPSRCKKGKKSACLFADSSSTSASDHRTLQQIFE